jgi:hypothetical protein
MMRASDLARVRRIALALPGVEEGKSWGAPAFKLHGQMMACAPTHKSAEPDSLAVRLDFSQRDELLAADPDTYYLKEHYVDYPCLLVRLKRIHSDALRDLLGMAWRYVDGRAKRRKPTTTRKKTSVRMAVTALCLLASGYAEARQTAEDVSRALVIGQAYASGNVFVGGFVEDEKRTWPARLTMTPLRDGGPAPAAAEFVREVVLDSDEQYYFPQREDGGSAGPDDLFSTIDAAAVTDRNLARYRTFDKIVESKSIIAWDDRLAVIDLVRPATGQLRPLTEAERQEVAADKLNAKPKGFECTTEPRFLDSARVILTGKIAKTSISIRLSRYETPGCAGHLSEIYVLDILEPGRDPRRVEFRHYVGVL